MSEKANIEDIVMKFETRGLAAIMTTPANIFKFLGSSSTSQSPQHIPELETRREAPINLTPTYLSPRVSRELELQLTKNEKYPILLLPMLEDVKEEGASHGHILSLKYQDYNLQDLEKCPHVPKS